MNDIPEYELQAREEWAALTGGEKDVLIALCKHGPLWDGDVPSKVGRDGLVLKGLAARIVIKDCQGGYQAATARGGNIYRWGFRAPRREVVGRLVGNIDLVKK